MKELNRRTFLKMAGGASASLAFGALVHSGIPTSARAATKVNQMVIGGGGGALVDAYRKAFYGPFTATTGVKIIETSNETGKLKAMVDSGNIEADVIQVPAPLGASLGRQGLLEPLDYSIIKQDDLIKGYAHKFSIACDINAFVIAWNTKKYSKDTAPKSWADVWDTKKFPGFRGMWKRTYNTMDVALLADGVQPKNLYPLDIERSLKSLTKIKESIRWWVTGAQSAQLLVDGEVDLGACWNGRLQGPKNAGAPIDFTFANAYLEADALVVLKGCKNKQLAMEYIAFVMQPKNQATLTSYIQYLPINLKAYDMIDPKIRPLLPNPPGVMGAVKQDVDWWAANETEAQKRFDAWLLT